MVNLKVFVSVLGAILLTVLTTSAAWAQSVSSAQVSGVVRDSSGGALPGADVTITKIDTGAVRSVVTGVDGTYVFPNLPVGPYQLKVDAAGIQHLPAGRHRAAGQLESADQRHAGGRRRQRTGHGDREQRRWSKRTRPASARSWTTSASSSCRSTDGRRPS